MKYAQKGKPSVNVPSVTGAQVSSASFISWQPSTWPVSPGQFDSQFYDTLKTIFEETIINELRNVVHDVKRANSSSSFPLEHRGHVIAVACMCALDAISSYGYKNDNVRRFVRKHFPDDYKPYAYRIYPEYRLSLVHAWNLFGDAALLPGNDPISEDQNGQICFGILNFLDAFEQAVSDFISKLGTDAKLQARSLHRYREVTGEIKRSRSSKNIGAWLAAGAIGLALGVGATLLIELRWPGAK